MNGGRYGPDSRDRFSGAPEAPMLPQAGVLTNRARLD
jgi:hypothetical protein